MRPHPALLLLAALACGCGSNVRVNGKVVRGGHPLARVGNAKLDVSFHPIADPAAAKAKGAAPDLYSANVGQDGSFDVPGVEGDGVPPGKYRVAVALRAGKTRNEEKTKSTAKDKSKARKDEEIDRDYLDGKFGPDNSPIVREVTSSSPLVIDLDNPAP